MIKHSAQLEFEPGSLEVSDLTGFLMQGQIPADAKVSFVIRQRGHQRDPYSVVTEIRVEWQT